MKLIQINKAQQTRAPGWFMLAAILAVLWNGVGVAQFLQQASMTPDTVALLTPERQALHTGTPGWANAAFGVAVFAGLLGSLLLVMRSRHSVTLLQISLLGVLAQMFHAVILARAAQVLGPQGLIMPLVVTAIAVFLVLLSFKARIKGWVS